MVCGKDVSICYPNGGVMMPQVRTFAQIRSEFLEFFRQKDHAIVPSAPMIPWGDSSILFINAGMNQFKDVFLGTGTRPYTRAADSQKCLRVSGKHNDLEEVGHDTYHHTFFEMLGNWSFGDYFKDEAIAWAWELLHERWKLPADRLYATVHEGDAVLGLKADDEAARLWRRHLPADQVLYGSTKDNFWMMGETGPCGPCSEIHIDLRSDDERARIAGSECVNQADPLVIELWNLVFIQFNAIGDNKLERLTACHVDTGMGLERLTAILQGKTSTYDTDIFDRLMCRIAELTPLEGVWGYDDLHADLDAERIRVAMRVVADHIRAIVFAIADGAVPGNVGQGYVIRRILRRAVRYGYTCLAFKEPFLCQLVKAVVDQYGPHYPDLCDQADRIIGNVKGEEAAFLKTLGKGLELYDVAADWVEMFADGNGLDSAARQRMAKDAQMMDLLRKAYPDSGAPVDLFARDAGLGKVPGAIAFLLHDTYGFPVDLTQLIARERGNSVDMERYEALMTEQRKRARKAATFDLVPQVIAADAPSTDATQFVGYEDKIIEDAQVLAVVNEERICAIILDRTPFYAESGGQVGDMGELVVGGETISVLDTQVSDSCILHIVNRLPDSLEGLVIARIDEGRRHRIAKHHTATHLMHAALREVLGSGVAQKGSLVAPGHLRFDFNHYQRVSPAELKHIQDRVNEMVQRNIEAEIEERVPYAEALSRGATALFGEKYGDYVRVVTFDEKFSVELCGGTHVQATGELGLFLLQSEGSVAAGVRRVEAVTGKDALAVVVRQHDELEGVRGQFKGGQHSLEETVADLLETNRALQKQVERLQRERLAARLDILIQNARNEGHVRLVTGSVEGVGMDALRVLGQSLRDRMGKSSVSVLGTADLAAGKAYLVAAVSDDLVCNKVHAGRFVRQLAQRIGGGGGGRPELATAGGRQPEKLGQALDAAGEVLRELMRQAA